MAKSFSVYKPAGRSFYYVQWEAAGATHTRSTKQRTRRDADRIAAEIIRSAEAQRGCEGNESWVVFRQLFREQINPGIAANTRAVYRTVFAAVEETLKPVRMDELNERAVGRLIAAYRRRSLSDETIRTYLAHLRAALRWAADQGLIQRVPKIERPKRAKKQKLMKGRAITREEFERMLAAIPGELSAACGPSWTRFLEGLWLSSLRLDEALCLTWDVPGTMRVDVDDSDPQNSRFLMPAETHKANREELLPLTPDFVAFLQETPAEGRTGKVFRLRGVKGAEVGNMIHVSKVITRLGEAAGVVVRRYAHKAGREKFASAHDLRRSFGERWSKVVRPQTLQLLMRHEQLATTMRYYVAKDATAAAEELWRAVTNTFTNIPA